MSGSPPWTLPPGRGPRESAERFFGERRRSGMSEACRLRRAEGYGACGDEVEEARAELYREQAEGLRLEREREGSKETDRHTNAGAGLGPAPTEGGGLRKAGG